MRLVDEGTWGRARIPGLLVQGCTHEKHRVNAENSAKLDPDAQEDRVYTCTKLDPDTQEDGVYTCMKMDPDTQEDRVYTCAKLDPDTQEDRVYTRTHFTCLSVTPVHSLCDEQHM